MAEYNTAQRKRLAEFMEKYSELALSLDGWTSKLKEEGFTVGRTTVYRTLHKLEREGRVISTREHRHTRYQIAACQGEHLHLKCTGCGRLYHLSHEHSHALKSSLPEGFSVNNVIYGVCADCEGV